VKQSENHKIKEKPKTINGKTKKQEKKEIPGVNENE
jgi:hypothetical protein